MDTIARKLIGVLLMCGAMLTHEGALGQSLSRDMVLGLDLSLLKKEMSSSPLQARLALDKFSVDLGIQLSKQADVDPLGPEFRRASEIAKMILAILYTECVEIKAVLASEHPVAERPDSAQNLELAFELAQILCSQGPVQSSH